MIKIAKLTLRRGQIIELAGLSGTGKSTACKIISKHPKYRRQSLSPIFFRWLSKLFIDRLFLPFAIIKFRPVFKELHRNEKKCGQKSYSLWSTLLILKAARTKKTPRTVYINPTLDLLFIMNRVIIMYFLARVEVFIRNRCLIMDDGYIQRGLSVWLRSQEVSKNHIVNIYYSSIPLNVCCIVVTCGAEEALRRVVEIRGKLNTILEFISNSKKNRGYLNQQFEEMSQILEYQVNRMHLSMIKVDSMATKEEVANLILSRLESLKYSKKNICWIC